ncbi:MAG: hypothetical protein Solumvirus1_52 [Solumvirus sp.]|uniref:Uncharacterized protein n=1 Tax=Solumvirus sp. TaxID=2487773 RepID=A0A3G5AG77_9VIRU|nr:MAG: hypothetical protein Solumvirus1_52 [Solumvirus sp.]
MSVKFLKAVAKNIFEEHAAQEGNRISIASERLRIFINTVKLIMVDSKDSRLDALEKDDASDIFDSVLSEIKLIADEVVKDSSSEESDNRKVPKKDKKKIGELCAECKRYDCQHVKKVNNDLPKDDEDDIPSGDHKDKKDEKGDEDDKDASPIPDSDSGKMPPPNAIPSSSNDSTKGVRERIKASKVSFTSIAADAKNQK